MFSPVFFSMQELEGRANVRQMAQLKDSIEAEVHAAHDEYIKMESHIKLYITEMEQSI